MIFTFEVIKQYNGLLINNSQNNHMYNVCVCVRVCMHVWTNFVYGFTVFVHVSLIIIMFTIFVYTREKVKGVPEELKFLKANKHYLHATELLTITGKYKIKSPQKYI